MESACSQCGLTLPPPKWRGRHRRLCNECRLANKRECERRRREATATGRNGKIKPGERRSPATEFKKGVPSGRGRPMFSEMVTARGVTKIKVPIPPKARSLASKGIAYSWVPKARWLWEQMHGPVPTGRVIAFADGDKGNFAPGNLVCVRKATMARVNRRKPIGSKQVYRTNIALRRLQTEIQIVTGAKVSL